MAYFRHARSSSKERRLLDLALPSRLPSYLRLPPVGGPWCETLGRIFHGHGLRKNSRRCIRHGNSSLGTRPRRMGALTPDPNIQALLLRRNRGHPRPVVSDSWREAERSSRMRRLSRRDGQLSPDRTVPETVLGADGTTVSAPHRSGMGIRLPRGNPIPFLHRRFPHRRTSQLRRSLSLPRIAQRDLPRDRDPGRHLRPQPLWPL